MELPAELEAAIRAAPDDRAGYLVAADWLTSQGDPQGELIALSLSPPTHAVRSRIAELHGQLEPLRVQDFWTRFEWRWGFVISSVLAASPTDVRLVLRSPVARFVRKLVLELPNAASLKVIAEERRALASLRTLVVHCDADPEVAGAIAGLVQATPALEELRVVGAESLGTLVLPPHLRELSIHHDALDVESKLPHLERLGLQLGGKDPAWLRRPALRSRWPALRRLSIAGARLGDVDDWRGIDLARALDVFDLIRQNDVGSDRVFVVDRIGERTRQRAGLLAMTGTDGVAPGTLVEITGREKSVVGRMRNSDLVLRGLSIGRRHASIERRSAWCVVDNGVGHGTRVNGYSVETCALRSGDAIAFGNHDFRFLAGDDLEAQANEVRERFALSST